MAHQGAIELVGEVTEALPSTLFRVKVKLPDESEERIILCTLSGKMRIHFVKILPGDRVRVEITPYDKTRGRITYRL